MIRLMNSAMMPQAGTYRLTELTEAEFTAAVIHYFDDDELISYIGYPATAEMIADMTERPIEVNREQTALEDGDQLLIARLNYRVKPGAKADATFQKNVADPADFSFFLAHYEAPK